jgi:integrase
MADANPTRVARSQKAPGRVTGHVKLLKGKRGDSWYLRYRLSSGRQVQKRLGPAWTERSRPPAGYFTRKTAQAALDALLTDVRRGAAPDPDDRTGKTFADAVAAWLHYVEHDKARRASTVRGYRNVGNILNEEFGAETALEEITTERIDAYRRRLLDDGKVTRRTIQQRMVLLHGLLRRAQANRWIPENPADGVERVNVPRSDEFNVLTVEQVEAVAREAESMFAAAIIVAAFTGLRTGELRALRWRDVDFLGATVRVVRNMPTGGEEGAPKSGKGRSVPLIDQAARELDRLSRREHFTGPDDRVFAGPTGGMLGEDALRDALYEAMEGAGIDRKGFPAKTGFVFHDLRHTFGTLGARVFPLHDLQAFMGHASITTTMIYAHSVPRNDAAQRFASAVEQAKGDAIQPPVVVDQVGTHAG